MKRNDLSAVAYQSGAVQTGSVNQEESATSWTFLVKVVAAFGTVGGLLLHLIGYIGHQSYLTAWGIDPGLFPKPVDEIAMTGYLAFMDRSVSILAVIENEVWKLLGLGAVIAAYVFTLLRLSKSDKREKVLSLLRRIPEWVSDLVKSLGVTTVILASFPVALLLALFFMAIPAIFGDSFGRSLAEKEYKNYSSGCKQATGSSKCFEVHKDGKSVAHGFLIDSSATHIALFDVDKMQARAIAREGTELITELPHQLPAGSGDKAPNSNNN